ncbi:MAG: hypothetical protein HYR96_03325 [Deltaproteobacteria bacterium]|nr:hypothetical protein [Deltaproteobacteria bacterium]
MTGGNQVLVVKDYGKAHEVAVALLSELQRIKALREEGALKALFAKYSPTEAINEPWAKILIDRGKDIAFFRGYIDQPWRIDKHRAQALGERTLEGAAPYWAEFYGAK